MTILSVLDAQDMYMKSKAFTAQTISELEDQWHKPAIERLARVMEALAKSQGVSIDQLLNGNQPMVTGGNDATEQQYIL